ncbi:MAG: helix-turn-helix domain-containing protein [Armatimonadota bacterium]|nr:helix-turn-helix domain-containing protein [Armatimonadota bacterium]MDR7604404.1 helix-turn-helix domain-containing protein [Armatimonadota bacterium]
MSIRGQWERAADASPGPGSAAHGEGLLSSVYEVIRQAVRDGMVDALQAAGLAQQESRGKYYTPREAADRLRLHPYTVYELVKQGKVRAVRVGRRILIPEAAIRELGS